MSDNSNDQKPSYNIPRKATVSRLSNYKYGKVLGKGASATVHLAQDKRNEAVVAIKETRIDCLDDESYDLCKKEVHLLNIIKSQNVISCFEHFYKNDFLYVSLEFADGGDFEFVIEQMQEAGRLLSERAIWYYFHQICNGLKDMHEKRILHRDLKPANIFVTSKGKVKIGDLGLSCILDDQTDKVYDKAGTEYYIAPEKNGTDGYDFKSDIWSLGCILYEFCTLRSPFSGEKENVYSLHKKINEAKFPPLPTEIYSRQLNFFMIRCLSVDPRDRPSAVEAHMAAERMYLIFDNMLLKHKKSLKAD